ncbi:hypothetical protein DRF67_11915 [Chryseobacterium pennipullorum]|uniref:Uncharacterized protein n=1 Tax=Chryseobacterium pennipullorum TaxID=2258963 RepID=A0A3D9B122_9FLAO|nr:hypothetical protein DRF67_11915 [Chryseobacterium pennipullorum]
MKWDQAQKLARNLKSKTISFPVDERIWLYVSMHKKSVSPIYFAESGYLFPDDQQPLVFLQQKTYSY